MNDEFGKVSACMFGLLDFYKYYQEHYNDLKLAKREELLEIAILTALTDFFDEK